MNLVQLTMLVKALPTEDLQTLGNFIDHEKYERSIQRAEKLKQEMKALEYHTS